MVRHRIAHGTAETVSPIPLFGLFPGHIGIGQDEGTEGFPGIILRTRDGEQLHHLQIFDFRDVRSVFPRPVPAETDRFFKEFISCIQSADRHESTSGNHTCRNGRIVAAGKDDHVLQAGNDKRFGRQHSGIDPVFLRDGRFPHHYRRPRFIFGFPDDLRGGAAGKSEMVLKFFGRITGDMVGFVRRHDDKSDFAVFHQFEFTFHIRGSDTGRKTFRNHCFRLSRFIFGITDISEFPDAFFRTQPLDDQMHIEVRDMVQIGNVKHKFHRHGFPGFTVWDRIVFRNLEHIAGVGGTAEDCLQSGVALAPFNLHAEHDFSAPVFLSFVNVKGFVVRSFRTFFRCQGRIFVFGNDRFRQGGEQKHCHHECQQEFHLYFSFFRSKMSIKISQRIT